MYSAHITRYGAPHNNHGDCSGMSTFTRRARHLLLLTTALVAALPAYPQPLMLEEVVVTAQKRTENIRDVPISITALSEDFLNDAGVTDIGELSKVAPNLVVNATPYTGFVAMRGLGSGNNKGFERSVALVIDGVYYGRQDYLFEALADVQRVEVLRGPQGTLFGKNAIAGALNVTTGQASPEFTGTVSLMGGAFDRERVRIAAGGSVIDDFLNVRIAYDHDKQDGVIENTTGEMNPADNPDPIDTDDALRNRDYELGRIRLHFPSLIDGMDVNFTATSAEIYSNGSGTELGAATEGTLALYRDFDPQTEGEPDRKASTNANQDTLREGMSYSLQVDYELGEYILTGIWGKSQFDKDHVLDADFGPLEAILLTGDDEYEQSSLELRIASPPGDFEYVAGLYYFESDFVGIGQVVLYTERVLQIVEADRSDGDLPLTTILATATPGDEVINNNRFFDQRTESYAAFGQATWNVSDALALIVGARYSEEKKIADAKLSFNSEFSERFFNTFLNEEPYDEQLSRKEYDFSPKFSVRYDLTEEITLYATYATAFKAGGFNEQAVDNTNLEFEPEEATTIEAGLKSRFLNGAATLNVGLFHTDFENLQVSLYNGTNFVVGNAATATTYGVEIEGQLLPAQWLSLGGSIAYLHARYDEFTDGQCIATSGEDACDLSGRELTRAPEWEATFAPMLSFSKLIPWLGDNVPASIGMGLNLSYRAHQYFSTDLDPIDTQPGHTEIGGQIKISGLDENWSLAISVRNLNDKKIKAHGQDVPLQPGTHLATMEPETRWYGEFQYRW